MLRAFFLLALSLFPSLVLAADHSCDRRIFGALGPNAFTIISNCTAIFCDPQVTDVPMKQGLAHVDDRLVDLRVANAEFGLAIQKFVRACKALGGDMNQTGPKMEAMIGALHDLERKKEPVSLMYQALQRDPEETLFNQVSARAIREFRQPKCQSDINDNTVNLLTESQTLLDKSDIDCSNPSKMRPAAAPLARPLAPAPAR